MSECVFSQNYSDATAEIMRHAKDVHFFNKEFQQEKVFLQLDNTSYFQGETIWFKAFVVNASSMGRSESGVLYVELLSPTGVLLQQKKLKVIAGQADGFIKLTDTEVKEARDLRGEQPYPSGYYEIRAYTRYMLNFNHSIVYSRVIPVFKTPIVEGKYDQPVLLASKHNRYDKRPEANKLKQVNVSYFPEGGRLLSRYPGRVAFKVTDEDGMPIDGELKVVIRSDDETIVAPVIHDGMGSFYVKNGKEITKCSFVCDGEEYKVNGPHVDDVGVSMRLDRIEDSLSVTIYNGLEYQYHQVENEPPVGVAVCCCGQILICQSSQLIGDSIKLTLPAADFPIGVCDVTVFDNYGSVLCTRHFFNYRDDFSVPVLTASFDRNEYGPYEPISLSMTLSDGKGQPFRDRFCLSVRDGANIETAYHDNLATSLLLSSDLKGLVLNPQYYFESSNQEHRQAMDLLCMVQGWERYNFGMMDGSIPFKERYRKEKKLQLNGWVTGYTNKYKMIEDVHTFLSIAPLENDSLVFYGHYKTEQDGYFGFDINDFYGYSAIMVRLSKKNVLGKEKKMVNMIFERGETPFPKAFANNELVFGDFGFRKEKQKNGDIIYGSGSMYSDEGIKLPEVEIVAPRKYIDYFTFKALDVEKDVEAQLDLGEWPTTIMSYLLDKGYHVDPSFDALEGSYEFDPRANGQPEEIKAILRDFGPESYAFQDEGTLNHYPVFWYVHNSKGIHMLRHREIWNINTINVESLLVFDEPYKATEIKESVPLFMDAIIRNKNVKAQKLMNGNVTRRDFLLVEVKIKDRMVTDKEQVDRGKRVTTYKGF
ncbi:MAG: hypothetical protein MJY96_10645, partial [Bacteroidaceae bacterium]|nr:hypothetical protein [Bacteroidaceae bacterium]